MGSNLWDMGVFWLVDGAIFRELPRMGAGGQQVGEPAVEKVSRSPEESAAAPAPRFQPPPSDELPVQFRSAAPDGGQTPQGKTDTPPETETPAAMWNFGHSDVVERPRLKQKERARATRGVDPVSGAVLPGLAKDDSGEESGSNLISVDRVMSPPVLTLPVKAAPAEAVRLFGTRHCHHIPLVDDQGILVGVVSDRDLFREPGYQEKTSLAELMSSPVLTAYADAELRQAARAMMAHKISCLPVIDHELRPLGLVTVSDVLGYLIEHPAMQLWKTGNL